MIRRKLILIVFLLAVVGVIAAALWFFERSRQIPVGQSWHLPDGSEISLAAVTFGQKHRVRYDNRWQDILSPVFPVKWQSKFGSRVASHTTAGTNSVVVWLWQRSPTTAFAKAVMNCTVAVADENGLESEVQFGPNCNYFLPTGRTLSGWELQEIPHRSKQIRIRIYTYLATGDVQLVGEFKIPNRSRMDSPQWAPESLPATRSTNGLDVTLVGLTTGLTSAQAGGGSAAKDSKAFSRAEFQMRQAGRATLDWSAAKIVATAASGEARSPLGYFTTWWNQTNVFGFSGSLWPEESAWKLKVEFVRTAHFPVEELWTIKNIPIPGKGKISKFQSDTNIYAEEIEFLGLSSPGARLPEDWSAVVQPEYNLHARTPYPLLNTHLTLVEVRDDYGRNLQSFSFARNDNTGARGATLRQTDYGFGVKIPDGAKSLDVTFAFTKGRVVEFLARPLIAGAPVQP